MNRFLSILLMVFVGQITVAQKPIIISNPIAIARSAEVVAVPWNQVLKSYPKIDTANFKVVSNGVEIPYQLEKLGTAKVQNLLVYVSLKAKGAIALTLKTGKHAPFKSMTYARYVPERKDDFAWESDKIAYRAYGKALEGTNEDANGIDVWAKRSTDLVINEWYKTGDYHADHGKGLDFYSVGLTLGAGDIAPLADGKIVYPKHYRRFKILDNGPLRSTFVLEFDAFDVAGIPVTISKTISLDAGSRMNKVVINVSYKGNAQLPMVVGLVTAKQPGGKIYHDAKKGIAYYWQMPTGNHGTIGIATVVKGSFVRSFESEGQLLNQISASSNKPFTYYTGAAWDKQGEITNANQWLGFLKNYRLKINNPLRVKMR